MLSSGTGPVIVLGVLAHILWRTLQSRPARTDLAVPLVLIVLGGAGLVQYLSGHPLPTAAGVTLAASYLLDAIGLGALRACTVRLWSQGGQLWARGNWLTVAMWIAGLAIHFLLDSAAGLTGVSAVLILYLGLTWMAQRLVVEARGRGRLADIGS